METLIAGEPAGSIEPGLAVVRLPWVVESPFQIQPAPVKTLLSVLYNMGFGDTRVAKVRSEATRRYDHILERAARGDFEELP